MRRPLVIGLIVIAFVASLSLLYDSIGFLDALIVLDYRRGEFAIGGDGVIIDLLTLLIWDLIRNGLLIIGVFSTVGLLMSDKIFNSETIFVGFNIELIYFAWI